jgi:DNA (cytosine-5)-methyltransferase 1
VSRHRRTAQYRALRVASLFSGVGGIELGLQRAGHHVLSFCESDPAAHAVLNARFPGVDVHWDVQTLRRLPRNTDVVTAGFPCQDLSQAGATAGIFGSQSGLVWEVLRLLESCRPRFALFENVPFMLRLHRGRAISLLVENLERMGFSWAYRTVDARSFGIPQRRPRVFLLAARDEDPRAILLCDNVREIGTHPNRASSYGFYWTEGNRGIGWALNAIPALKPGSALGIASAPAMILPRAQIATPHICDAERLQGFPPHWTASVEGVGKRGDRWRLVGNAVNVRIARWIGYRLARPGVVREEPQAPLLRAPPWPKAAFWAENKRYTSDSNEFPVSRTFYPLHEFLRFKPIPLSVKATTGVLKRLRASRLKTAAILLPHLESHLAQTGAIDPV